ncbi:hypothetical protein B0H17DRAFT_1136082 [Mycena rosella]|uniref:Uncharacterized protein n=1 Tax=Mycena rosella TaxID=1033263 RepID=A0AAD7DBY7_MYCRO|nr:hypothetical protein B0H17DRAFT_1136082 [Mycena rosella]
MRAVADKELRKFRVQVHKLERDYDELGFTPASSYLSNTVITLLLDNLLIIWTREVLAMKILQWKYYERHGEALMILVRALQVQFAADFEVGRLERNEKARLKNKRGQSRRRRCAAGEEVEESEEDEPVEDSEEEEDRGNSSEEMPDERVPVVPPQHKRKAGPLGDITNALKRPRAAPAPLASAVQTLGTFGPQYKARIRKPV